MKKHKLLAYELFSRRMRRPLFVGMLVFLTLGIIDLFRPIFGDLWYWLWVATAVLGLLWLYYGVLMRRASVQIHPKYVRLQGPLRGVNISYGRIDSVSSVHMAQHYPKDSLKKRDRTLLGPLYQQTLIFAELKSFPKTMRRPRLWFIPYVLGTSQQGLLLATAEWMLLSRDLDTARTNWFAQRKAATEDDKRSLASRILDY